MLFNAPESIYNIREIKSIYAQTDRVGHKLDFETEELEGNIYISSANDEKLKKLEQLLDIRAGLTDTLDVRRFRVKSKIYQRLPYSYRVLQSKLDSLCGEDGYSLHINVETQWVECTIGPDQHSMFKNIYGVLEDIAPMNLLLRLITKFPQEFKLVIGTKSKLHVMSDFYPRNNLEVLLMNGIVCFDGSRYFNGYNAEYKIDFYPVIFYSNSSSVHIMHSKTDVMIRSGIVRLIDFNQRIFISASAETGFKQDSIWNGVAAARAATEVVHRIIYKSSVDEKIEAASRWSASTQTIVNVDNGMRHKEKIAFKQDVRTASFVTVKKDLWYLDGSEQLDGSRLLNARVQTDEL